MMRRLRVGRRDVGGLWQGRRPSRRGGWMEERLAGGPEGEGEAEFGAGRNRSRGSAGGRGIQHGAQTPRRGYGRRLQSTNTELI